ncbi:MAG: UDP-N-acetylmuramoyl-L-alanyl-D-glutamate--2,6-diaminopimelate ligase [Acidobacteriaceae bacterium]|nr:UDP-N-acetylmuramoyl-L-alanyl-D-glutamate--2,6-diaminopimelate ligase [Acidobacteriaceae bacterium]
MLWSDALTDVAAVADAFYYAPVQVSGVEYDSRRVSAGTVFVAMRGETTDGNRYIDAAIAQGAAAIVTDSREAFAAVQAKHTRMPVVQVEHGRRALATISANLFGHPEKKLAVSAVTGTNGKTTTAFLLEAMLRSAGKTCVLVGTIEYHVGDAVRSSPHTTPEARDLLELFRDGVAAGASEAVMEMSSHALEQERAWGVPVDTAIFTNLTQDHLDYHHTMEEYFGAKRRLFAGVGAAAPRVAVVNADDEYGLRLEEFAREGRSEALTYGIERGDFRAEKIVLRAGATEFAMQTPVGAVQVCSHLTGRVNVYNLLAAAAAGHARGLTLEQIAAGAEALTHVPGRFQVVREAKEFTVVVDYAHTPDALRNLTTLARELAAGARVITLFGCGGDRDRAKRPLMGKAAGEGSDVVVLTSDNPRSEEPEAIIADALPGVRETTAECIVEADRAKAIAIAIRNAKAGDIVLLAGKGHETTQVLRDGAVPFDDAEVAAAVLKEMA